METKVWLIFQTISKQELFIGVYTDVERAVRVVNDIIRIEDEQDYRQVDNLTWYGTTRKIEVLPKVLNKNPVSDSLASVVY